MISCRILLANELPKYAQFIKARRMDSLCMYFGYPITDIGIEQLLESIEDNPSKHRIVVAEDADLEIVGTIHIANISDTEVEFGVMVAESHRNMGISSIMMEYALAWCQNRCLRDVYMHCLSYNAPILHLVRKYGLEVSKDHGDADARVTLPLPNIFTLGRESVARQQNTIHHNILSFKKLLAA